MARLNEVLGALLKDVVDARAAADKVSMEYLEQYKADPFLSLLPVPRVDVRDISLTLRFAFQGTVEAPDNAVASALNRTWLHELERDEFPRVVRELLARNSSIDERLLLDAAAAAAKGESIGDFGVLAFLAGDHRNMLSESVAFFLAAKKQLPAADARKLPNNRDLAARLRKILPKRLEAFLPTARRTLAAQRASSLTFDVAITGDELDGVAEGSVQELTLGITMDDLELDDSGNDGKVR
ncbi:MAG: hypothetical protein GY711_09060 [bacterium]|nr:hypothetical protein [bacterium]